MKVGFPFHRVGQHNENEVGERDADAHRDSDRGFATLGGNGQRNTNQNKGNHDQGVGEPFTQFGTENRSLSEHFLAFLLFKRVA